MELIQVPHETDCCRYYFECLVLIFMLTRLNWDKLVQSSMTFYSKMCSLPPVLLVMMDQPSRSYLQRQDQATTCLSTASLHWSFVRLSLSLWWGRMLVSLLCQLRCQLDPAAQRSTHLSVGPVDWGILGRCGRALRTALSRTRMLSLSTVCLKKHLHAV